MTTVVTRTPADILGTLNEIEARNAPARLYVAGDVSLLAQGPRVATVGSREASAEGLRRARVLARVLTERGIIVVSGLAKGVDRAAHEEAMEAGGRTIAVIGTLRIPSSTPICRLISWRSTWSSRSLLRGRRRRRRIFQCVIEQWACSRTRRLSCRQARRVARSTEAGRPCDSADCYSCSTVWLVTKA